MIVNNIKGDQALKISPGEYLIWVLIVASSSCGKRHMDLGFQNLRQIIRQTIEPIPAMISGKAGPRKLEVDH